MRVTRKSLLILSGILIGCVVVTLLLSFAGRGGKTQAQATTYLFAKYDSPDALMAASIENSSGSVTIATKDGTCYIDGDDGRNPNSQAITEFFAAVYRLPLEELVEGASSADDQYGLNTPQATVMLEDVKQEGLMFKIGAQIRLSVRRVLVHFASACPYQDVFRQALQNLNAYPMRC